MAVFAAPEAEAGFVNLPILRAALREKRVLSIAYARADGQTSTRRIRPLQLQYWGRVWICSAWCEVRQDFRMFRADRIQAINQTGETFTDEPGKTLSDCIRINACEGL